MNACKEFDSIEMVKTQISELDRLIFVLTNKRGKAKALKTAQAMPWSYIEGMKEENRLNTLGYLENGIYDLEKRNVIVYNADSVATTESEENRFKIQNSFDWTLHELLNGAFRVKRHPVHTRKNIKRVERMYKDHHGVKLDWNLAANHFPEFFPSTKTVPNRIKGAIYKHSTKRGRWVSEDMVVLPMLFKLKVLRDEAVSFYIEFEMKLACKQSGEMMRELWELYEGNEGFSDAFFPPLVVSDELKEKIDAQGGTLPEVFLPTTIIDGDGAPRITEPIRFYQGVNELTGD